VAQKVCGAVHYFEHSRDDFFQDFCSFAHNSTCDLVCKGQNALQSIQKAQRYLVGYILFLQELNGGVLPPFLTRKQ